MHETAARAVFAHIDQCPECRQEWIMVQNTLLVLSTATQPLPSADLSEKMWRECSERVHQRIEENRLGANQPPFLAWLKSQPRWGWAALGTAIVVFGGAWVLAPQDGPSSPEVRTAQTVAFDGNDPGTLVNFREPSREMETVVNHHSAMATDPFADRVGSTLVSLSASSP
jgi:hypothetical protein